MIIVIGEEGVDFINAAEFHVSLTADELLLLQQAAKEAKEAL